jgi:hypothetical protein
MKWSVAVRSLAVVVALVFAVGQAAGQAAAHVPGPEPVPAPPAATVSVPVAGTTSEGGTFAGQLTVQRFALKNDEVVAEAMVTGSVADAAGSSVRAFLTGPVKTVIAVRPADPPSPAPATRSETLVGRDAAGTPSAPVGLAPTCGSLQLEVAGLTLNVLGFVITVTAPISLTISGEPGSPLGDLVCQIVANLGDVPALVALLNQLLALLAGGVPSS